MYIYICACVRLYACVEFFIYLRQEEEKNFCSQKSGME